MYRYSIDRLHGSSYAVNPISRGTRMKVRSVQPDPRKNPDSPRVHGLRLAVDSSSATLREVSEAVERNEVPASLRPRLRRIATPRADADGPRRNSHGGEEGPGAWRERSRARGNWSVSPLWEAKILLGVLREQGLAGRGLVQAFEKWAPLVAGYSRAEMSRVYSGQTGREMSFAIASFRPKPRSFAERF
jgi:hypothetical protein